MDWLADVAGLLDGLRSKGLVGLSFTYSGGATGIATTDRDVRAPEDLKGLKIGVFGSEVDTAWLKSLGAIPVAVGHREESLPLARQDRLDGMVITWRNFERERMASDFAAVNLRGSSYLVSVTYVNEKYFEALPKAYRELIAKASSEAGRIERARTIELNENARRLMLAKGVRPVYLSEGNKGRFVSAVRPAYAGVIERVVGKALLEDIRNTPDAPRSPSVPLELARR